MLESRTLLVKTTVFMCFSDPIIDERSLHTIMLICIYSYDVDGFYKVVSTRALGYRSNIKCVNI